MREVAFEPREAPNAGGTSEDLCGRKVPGLAVVSSDLQTLLTIATKKSEHAFH